MHIRTFHRAVKLTFSIAAMAALAGSAGCGGSDDDTGYPEAIDPFQPGPSGVERVELDVTVEDGDGEDVPATVLTVGVYVPNGADAAPVVVFLPGFQLTEADFSSTDTTVGAGDWLASHGFATAVVTFGDGILSPFDHVDLARYTSDVIDELATRNADPESSFFGRLDLERLGVGGHSRGGKAAFLTVLNDERVDATFNLDPVDTVGGPTGGEPTPENPSVAPELMAGVEIPMGVVGSGLGGAGAIPCAPVEENYEQYFDAAKNAPVALSYTLPSAGHNDFATDINPILATFCEQGDEKQAVRTFGFGATVAFYQRYLNNNANYDAWLLGEGLPEDVQVEVRRND